MTEEEREEGRRTEDENDEPQNPVASGAHSSLPSGSGRTLGGDPAPPVDSTSSALPASSSTRSAPRTSNRKFATLGDLNRDQGHSHRGGHGREDDADEDEGDGAQDFFAGGEKSGLAVQNPGDSRRQVKDILEKARRYVPIISVLH